MSLLNLGYEFMAEGIPKKKTLGIHVLVIRPDARAEGLGASVRCRCSRIGPRYRGAGATFTDKVGATVTDPVVYRRLWIRSIVLKKLLFRVTINDSQSRILRRNKTSFVRIAVHVGISEEVPPCNHGGWGTFRAVGR